MPSLRRTDRSGGEILSFLWPSKKHQEDMDRYEQEFQQTQSEVYQKTRHFTSLTVPLTVIFVLILLNIVSFVSIKSLNAVAFTLDFTFVFFSTDLDFPP